MTRRVVVVGNGMAGARLVDELHRRDPGGTQVSSVVIGAEPHAAYNRVLLSTVLAGGLTAEAVRLQPEGWAERQGIDARTGITVLDIDRVHRQVRCRDAQDAESVVDYDVLVLATGSRPFVPPVPGLRTAEGVPAEGVVAEGVVAEGVVAFRTVTDCEQILDAVRPGSRVVVLGGGLLGLEAARGLSGRGAEVTVVHPAAHPMDRQLDAGGGAVLARVLTELGVALRLSSTAVQYRPGLVGQGVTDGRGVVLDDGSFLAADLVVVATGVRPQVELAQRAGLVVNNAIVVDDQLRTSDRRIRAIGECAEHRGSVYGLVQPAWDQAAVVADLLTGADPTARYTGSREVTKLKARDVDLAAMGDVSAEGGDPDIEVLSLIDASRGRYAKLVLREDCIIGAVLLGSPEAAAAVTQLYDHSAQAPSDRLGLLLGRLESGAQEVASPAHLPGRAVVCRCNSVTKNQLTSAWRSGADSVPALAAATRATTGCGGCGDLVEGICTWLRSTEPAPNHEAPEVTQEEGAA